MGREVPILLTLLTLLWAHIEPDSHALDTALELAQVRPNELSKLGSVSLNFPASCCLASVRDPEFSMR